MRILLSNDDGIYAAGIKALHEAVGDLAEVCVVAPDAERSAVGHAITLSDPIKAKWIERDEVFHGHAVSGTPADAVKLAVCALLDEPPDLVLSGINLGPNAGISILYSGTVSAATEGTILGIPSVALSLNTFSDPLWPTAIHFARKITTFLLKKSLPPGVLLNVNIPNLPIDQIKGIRKTRMGQSRFIETFDERQDPAGNTYYWMDGILEHVGDMKDTDLEALDAGYVSITPIGFDLTHEGALEELQHWDL